MSPSLRGYLYSLKLRASIIAKGFSFSDKARLMLFNLFASIPKTLLKRFPLLERYIRVIKENLVKGAVINFEGSRFYCIDVESLSILSHNFESWMWKYLYGLDAGSVFIDVGAHRQIYNSIGEEGGRGRISNCNRAASRKLRIPIKKHQVKWVKECNYLKYSGME